MSWTLYRITALGIFQSCFSQLSVATIRKIINHISIETPGPVASPRPYSVSLDGNVQVRNKYHSTFYSPANFNPMVPMMISMINASLKKSFDSPRKNIPKRTVPAAPIPVKTT